MLARYYRYRIGFKSKNQLPWFMVWIEYFNPDIDNSYVHYDLDWQVDFARIIWVSN